MIRIIVLAAFLISSNFINAQISKDQENVQEKKHELNIHQQKKAKERINFFVFTKEKSKKADFLSLYTLARARMKSWFHRKKFYVIKAQSSSDAAKKILAVLEEEKKLIKNIWFDSHGHYVNRYSSFRVGTDEFNYTNINDSNATKHLQKIAFYCDKQTKVGLGSCYAGADFYFPETDSTPACRMNGDSLMIGMGKIFKASTIYACESWVMAKPGIFKNRLGFAGYPLNKRFKDRVYEPVWERIGKWREYSFATQDMKNIPTIALDNCGNININNHFYNEFKKAKNKIAKTLKELKPGLASFH